MKAPESPISVIPEPVPAVDEVDTSYLETLMGYNATRASLKVIELFTKRMAVYELRHVDFSILSLITHNPGITSRQLCGVLGILPPNLVGKISIMEKRELVSRRPHPQDGRAVGLYLTETGAKLMADAERTATALEDDVTQKLSATEKKTLMRLLQKIYL
ncbi:MULTISPECIES: MarR family winged helix-turn-helix transcriptional regulator [Polaromonas]|uniref:MarR family winged helix-turn-helix transcriptional regulator n=1 Tax=Polaromonas aquatica TaxID=332657 RepID=A0ABW1TXK8_9BURK